VVKEYVLPTSINFNTTNCIHAADLKGTVISLFTENNRRENDPRAETIDEL